MKFRSINNKEKNYKIRPKTGFLKISIMYRNNILLLFCRSNNKFVNLYCQHHSHYWRTSLVKTGGKQKKVILKSSKQNNSEYEFDSHSVRKLVQ